MKKQSIWILMCVLAATAVVQAEEVKTTVDLNYVTKYIWRGFDVLDDKAAFQPSVNFAMENGLNFNVWSSFAGSAKDDGVVGTVDASELDYTISYKNTYGEDYWATDYNVGWRYYDYYRINSEVADMQEGFIELAWPKLIGNGFVPRYAYYHMWAARRTDGRAGLNGGPIHDLGFDYNWTSECAPELPLKFSWDIVYNDGTGTSTDNRANSHLADHDWTHILWGLSTSWTCPATGGKVTPGIWYQTSMDDSVNKNDELFSGLSYSLTF